MSSRKSDLQLKGHLFRRAGFGTTSQQLENFNVISYEQIVEELLDVEVDDGIDQDILYRHCPDFSGGIGMIGAQSSMLYYMIVSKTPCQNNAIFSTNGVLETIM